jgi:type VI protein secretion system component VasF
MWETLKDKLKREAVPPETNGKPANAAAPQSSLFVTILKEAIQAATPLLTSLLAAKAKGEEKQEKPQPQEGSDPR